jgi:hypothetical protein
MLHIKNVPKLTAIKQAKQNSIEEDDQFMSS